MSSVDTFLKKASPEQIDKVHEAAREIVSQIMSTREQEMTKLAELEGEVTVHATMAHLGMFKENFDKGRCWMCGERAPSPHSPYLRCDTCEEND